MTNPRHRHWVVGKHILRYLRGTIAYRLKYASNGRVLLLGYIALIGLATLLIGRALPGIVSACVLL